jgi:16S rRNA (uracil1498-N3)-methyltransferase
MRRSHDDVIEVIDGMGRLATGTIASQDKTRTVIQLTHVITEPPPSHEAGLILSLLKPSNLELAIEKAVEVGVDRIILFPGDRSEKDSLTHNQRERLDHIIISAAKQCGRTYLPMLQLMPSLAAAIAALPACDLFYGSPDATTSLTEERKGASQKNGCIVIGPEGGFSEAEERLLGEKAKPVRLTKNILRAETAAIVAVAYLRPF